MKEKDTTDHSNSEEDNKSKVPSTHNTSHNYRGFDTYGTLFAREIFDKKVVKKLLKRKKGFVGDLISIYKGISDKTGLAVRIYAAYLDLAINDVIDGDMVSFRTKSRYPVMKVDVHTESTSTWKFEEQADFLHEGIDYRGFGYRVPTIVLYYGPDSPYISRIVNVAGKYREKLYEVLKSGKKYAIMKDNVKKNM